VNETVGKIIIELVVTCSELDCNEFKLRFEVNLQIPRSELTDCLSGSRSLSLSDPRPTSLNGLR